MVLFVTLAFWRSVLYGSNACVVWSSRLDNVQHYGKYVLPADYYVLEDVSRKVMKMISLTEAISLWDEIPDEDGEPFDFKEFIEMVDCSIGVYNDVVLIDDVD